jgi:hypothetical protein
MSCCGLMCGHGIYCSVSCLSRPADLLEFVVDASDILRRVYPYVHLKPTSLAFSSADPYECSQKKN